MNSDEFVRQVLGLPLTNTERAQRINEILSTRPPADPTRRQIEELLERARQRQAKGERP